MRCKINVLAGYMEVDRFKYEVTATQVCLIFLLLPLLTPTLYVVQKRGSQC
jgi:hypothetical protein